MLRLITHRFPRQTIRRGSSGFVQLIVNDSGLAGATAVLLVRNVDLAADAVKPLPRATLYMRHGNDANFP
jgi:hypothetical protein